MNSCRRSSNSRVLCRSPSVRQIAGRASGVSHTLIFRSPALFSLHHASASVQLCCASASSIRLISENKSMSTRVCQSGNLSQSPKTLRRVKNYRRETQLVPQYPCLLLHASPSAPYHSLGSNRRATDPTGCLPSERTLGRWCFEWTQSWQGDSLVPASHPKWACLHFRSDLRADVSHRIYEGVGVCEVIMSEWSMQSGTTNLAFQGLDPAYHPFDGLKRILSTQRARFCSIRKVIGYILERSEFLFNVSLGRTEHLAVVFIGDLFR